MLGTPRARSWCSIWTLEMRSLSVSFFGLTIGDSVRGHKRDITMLQINTKKKFISSTSKDGRMKFWTPPSSWINYQEMEPLSYKNLEHQDNKVIFSDPEEKESGSSDNEDLENLEGFVVVKADATTAKQDSKKQDKFGGMLDESPFNNTSDWQPNEPKKSGNKG